MLNLEQEQEIETHVPRRRECILLELITICHHVKKYTSVS